MKGFLPDEEIVRQIVNDINWAREYRNRRKDDWTRFYKLYRGYIDPATYPFEANLATPTPFAVVETQVAYIKNAIFESGKFMEVLGKTQEGQMSSRSVGDLIDYHTMHSIDIYKVMDEFVRQLLMYGTSPFKLFWDYQHEWRTMYLPKYVNKDIAEFEEVSFPERIKSEPAGYTVDLWHYLQDPNASCAGDARFAGDEVWYAPAKIAAMYQEGILTDKKGVTKVLGGRVDDDVNDGIRERLEEIDIEPSQNASYVEQGKVHCVDYYGYLTKGWSDQNGRLSRKAKTMFVHAILAVGSSHGGVAINDAVPLLIEPAPFHHHKVPYLTASINKPAGEFYGIGDLEILESLFLEQRDTRNAMMDNLNRTLNKMFLVKNDSVFDENELMWRPAGTIHADHVDNVKILDVKPTDPALFRAQDDLQKDIEAGSGITDFVTGQFRSSTGFNDTATGISLIQQTALMRLGQKVQATQRMIRDMGQQMFALIAQYEPKGTTVRIQDPESAMRYRFVDVSRDALMHKYDFNIVNAPALGSKQARVQQLIQIMQIVLTTQDKTGFQLDMRAFMRRLLEETGTPNPQELLGFPQMQEPLPEMAGEEGTAETLIPPEEENRLIVEQHRMVHAKINEPHGDHITLHKDAHDNIDDEEAKTMLADHVQEHNFLMKQTRNMVANQMASEMQQQAFAELTQEAQQAQGGGNGKQSPQGLNMISGGTQRSPTGAGGMEDLMRAAGNMTQGNV